MSCMIRRTFEFALTYCTILYLGAISRLEERIGSWLLHSRLVPTSVECRPISAELKRSLIDTNWKRNMKFHFDLWSARPINGIKPCLSDANNHEPCTFWRRDVFRMELHHRLSELKTNSNETWRCTDAASGSAAYIRHMFVDFMSWSEV